MEVNLQAPVVASSQVSIESEAAVVWGVLCDIDGWPSWNSAVKRARVSGPLAEGTPFRWKASSLTISSVFQEVKPPSRLGWCGQTLGIPALHVYEIDPRPHGGTEVRSTESWDGLLASLFPRAMKRKLQLSLELGLESLKVEAERRNRSQVRARTRAPKSSGR
jgi:hypothetical protein